MRRLITGVLVLSCAVGMMRCDFPPEPPEKSADQTGGQNVPEIDKASSLIPLKAGNWWLYVVEGMGPPQGTRRVIARQIGYEGQIYYQMRYYLDRGPIPHEAFPLFLQNSTAGLKFFEVQDTVNISGPPRYAFTLPYPARVGTVTEEPTTGYRVVVVAKDTVVQGKPPENTYRCYRYDVFENQKFRHTFYIIPGSAFAIIESMIEQDRFRFITVGWVVQ